MVKINKHIEIVRSNTSWLSSMSQRSCSAIFNVLSQHYAEVGVTTVNDFSDLEALVATQPDLVFLGMKFVPMNPERGLQDSVKVWVSDYLDECGIAYTGSSQKAHERELNKPLAKQCVLDAGLKTSPFYVIKQDLPYASDDTRLTFPLFIKPTNRGGGLGIDSYSVAHNFEQLQAKVQSITTDLQSDSLVEEYLPGREFSVAILKSEYTDEYTIMPIELIAEEDERGVRLLSGEVKASNTERVIEVTDKELEAKVTMLALNVFYALGSRDYGRIDIRMDAFGIPHFLEANLLPSLISGYGSFPKACVLNMGLGYEAMILHIVRLGLAREFQGSEESLEDDYILPTPEIVFEAV